MILKTMIFGKRNDINIFILNHPVKPPGILIGSLFGRNDTYSNICPFIGIKAAIEKKGKTMFAGIIPSDNNFMFAFQNEKLLHDAIVDFDGFLTIAKPSIEVKSNFRFNRVNPCKLYGKKLKIITSSDKESTIVGISTGWFYYAVYLTKSMNVYLRDMIPKKTKIFGQNGVILNAFFDGKKFKYRRDNKKKNVVWKWEKDIAVYQREEHA